VSTRAVPPFLYPFLEKAEGVVYRAYDDANPNKMLKKGDLLEGVLTAGVGHTGSDVVIGMEVTREKVKAWLEYDVQVHAVKKLYNCVKPEAVDALTEHQYAALLSFVFNVGANKSWTIWKIINAGRVDGVEPQLMRFNKVRIKNVLQTSRGLTARRMAEVDMWNEADIETIKPLVPLIEESLPSSQVRDLPTPPAVMVAKPLSQSKSFMTGLLSVGISGAGVMLPVTQQVLEGAKAARGALEPFAKDSEFVLQATQSLATLGALASVATLFFIWMKQRQSEKA